ncbi:carbohydrate kinase family protein [Actinoplanes sp. NPDC051470]|uniref:carbohydrate kinase family protein n=1 Tax=Actinoplanes sp. NPDC051470 TaxID=3157224 RepID=UPI00343238DA
MSRILVVGDLVTDVVVVPAGAIEHGTDTTATITPSGGGQGANTAAWLAHAGAPVTLIASVGDDVAGHARVAELAAAGVTCAVRAHPDAATGTVVVLVTPEERTLITDPGACLRLAPDDVTTAVGAATDAVHLHLSGYVLLNEGSRAGGLAALAAARDRGLTVSVDASSAAPLRRNPSFLDRLGRIDLLLCNADEATVLAGPSTPLEQAVRLTGHARNVVVKLGRAGAVWAGPDGVVQAPPPAPVVVVDPTGAGDAFAAGLLEAWTGGAAPEAALAAGAALGAAAVTKIGARPLG